MELLKLFLISIPWLLCVLLSFYLGYRIIRLIFIRIGIFFYDVLTVIKKGANRSF
ncbi:MAG: hypothetical protein ABIA97_00650 [Candidatus Omnitrophota bacterium]